jgi:hypothetical protein
MHSHHFNQHNGHIPRKKVYCASSSQSQLEEVKTQSESLFLGPSPSVLDMAVPACGAKSTVPFQVVFVYITTLYITLAAARQKLHSCSRTIPHAKQDFTSLKIVLFCFTLDGSNKLLL